MATGVMMDGLT